MGHSPPKLTAPHSLLWWFMRGFWTILAAVHMWPLAIVSVECFTAPSVPSALGLLGVLGVTAVFALKAIDVVILQFHRPGLEFTAFVVITALIHGDAAAWRSSPALAAETTAIVAVASGGAIAGSRRLRSRFAKLLRSLAALLMCIPARHPFGMVQSVACLRIDQAWRRCTAARGPPLLVL